MLETLIILVLLYLLAIRCRGRHPAMGDLEGHAYAHRGLHDDTLPENSLGAFRAAVEAGFGIELDVHLLADGELAVIHDSLLNRVTGQPGQVEDLTAGELERYRLRGTAETIPTFSQVLDLVAGKVPLIVELKSADGNHAALAETACQVLAGYKGVFCMESFDPRCLRWLKKHRPDILRGQLTENYFARKNELPDYLRFLLTHCLQNFLTAPDFIACRFEDRRASWSVELCRRVWKARLVAWTLRTPEAYRAALREGWLPIFEGFRPEERLEAGEKT